jgi:hypothetical protein
LFSVENYGEIHNDETKQQLLEEWIVDLQREINVENGAVEINKDGSNIYREATEMDLL